MTYNEVSWVVGLIPFCFHSPLRGILLVMLIGNFRTTAKRERQFRWEKGNLRCSWLVG